MVLTHCKSSKQANIKEEKEMILEKDNLIKVTKVYFQKWDAGQEASGTGINIYFPELINKNNYKLEKVYFRNMIGKIQSGKASYFASLTSNKEDIVMSNAENAEYGNTIPTKPEPFPFKLKDNECIISYLDKDETKYFQVYNIVEN